MDGWLSTIQQWLSVDVPIGLTVAIGIGFIGSLIAVPLILVRMPADYFDTRVSRQWMKNHHPVVRLVVLTVKNIVGVVFFFAGLVMVFLPGPGLLTMLMGISLTDFPRKRELEIKIVGQPTVLHGINMIRHKFHKPPLILAPVS